MNTDHVVLADEFVRCERQPGHDHASTDPPKCADSNDAHTVEHLVARKSVYELARQHSDRISARRQRFRYVLRMQRQACPMRPVVGDRQQNSWPGSIRAGESHDASALAPRRDLKSETEFRRPSSRITFGAQPSKSKILLVSGQRR